MLTALSQSFPPVPSASRIARRAVHERFAAVLSRDTMSSLVLVVSELVTNAVEHGRGTIVLAIQYDGFDIHGSVVDEGSGFDYTPRTFDRREVRGRGLPIVDALVSRWGVTPGSTRVWFELNLVESGE